MKKTTLLYLLLLLLSACAKESRVVTIHGQLKGMENDTLYIYGMDRMHDRTDTIPVIGGIVEAELPIDTLVGTWLIFNDGQKLPLFLDKGSKISIKGNSDDIPNIEIKGNKANDELTKFNHEIKALKEATPDSIRYKAEEFIHSHPFSLVSIYLLDTYFVKVENPDLDKIRQLIEPLSGELKDRPYLMNLSERLENEEKSETGKIAPGFRLKDKDNKSVTRADFRNKYLLLHFWATWNEESLKKNEMLKKIYKDEKKNENIAFINISLDSDKKAWLDTIEKDTLEWNQLRDERGWNGEIAEDYCIKTLPTNLLISKNGRIEKYNLEEEDIQQLLERIEKEEKEKKEREKRIKQNKRIR